MLHIQLAGTPRQRGLIHGETYRDRIRELLELAQTVFLPEGLAVESGAILDRMFRYTRENEPEMAEEMAAIAEASNLSVSEIFLLNAVSAISAIGPNCTNIALSKSKDGPLLAKTSDIGMDYPYYLLQETTLQSGVRFIGIGWVGGVWIEVGLNHYGLAIGQSSAPIAPGQDGSGLPTLLCPRPALEKSRTVQEAVAYLESRRMAGKGLNMMLLDSNGDSAVVEKSGAYQHVRLTDQGVLYCTNHFLAGHMKDFKTFQVDGIEDNSRRRYDYLDGQPLDGSGLMGIPDLQELLRSHEGSICQHGMRDLATRYAYVLAPQSRMFSITDGYPCQNEFQVFHIEAGDE